MNITVLGAGAFGQALGSILESKGHQVTYYSRSREITLEDALAKAELLLLAIPSKALPELLPQLPTHLPLIVATKGILDINIFQQFQDIMVLSGPGFAVDINHHQPTQLTATDQRIIDLFATDWLTFDFTTDLRGVLLCGALKNVYAIMAGLQNLQPGTPAHEQYLSAALAEMRTILAMNQADATTVDLVCGQGDLRITCYYPSRNYEFGQKLISNPDYQPEKTVEGVSALKQIKQGIIKIPATAIIMKQLIERSTKWA